MSAALPFPRRVALLGATGSIGEKALAVIRRYPERFRLVAMAARGAVDPLLRAAREFGVPRLAVIDPAAGDRLRAELGDAVHVAVGAEAVASLAERDDVDVVVNGVVGRAGLEASLAAARSGKLLALANKESLVLAGELLMATARAHGASVLPVDSEHSGLFQALAGRPPGHVARLVITASGGPFRGRTLADLAHVTPEEALRHPIWAMGPRITVDSATLFNKGLEVIETHHLFGVPLDRIGVWVHPQSVVHAVVELIDGTMIAQLSAPDMLMPVQYAMSYPDRLAAAPGRALPEWGRLEFGHPDHSAFPALGLAFEAARAGGTAPAALNAADEVAVAAFLSRRIRFSDIPAILEEVLARVEVVPADSLTAIDEADRRARAAAEALVAARAR